MRPPATEIEPRVLYADSGVSAPFTARYFGALTQVAIVTDRLPIVPALLKHKGFGGIRRALYLAALFRFINDPLHQHEIKVVHFYIRGCP